MARPEYFRKIERRVNTSRRRLSVRPQAPWYTRVVWALLLILATGGIGWWAYNTGLESAGFYRQQAEIELTQLRNQTEGQQSEIADLSSKVASLERQVQMEHAASMELVAQTKSMNEENLRLKEDLTLFQGLTVPGTREGKLSVQYFRVERDALPDEYRYRLLLVQGGQQRAPAFQGKFQLLVNIRNGETKSVLLFPQSDATQTSEVSSVDGVDHALEKSTYQLNFKHYKRIEHSFRLPPDTTIESVQVRVYENGISQPKIQQSVSLS